MESYSSTVSDMLTAQQKIDNTFLRSIEKGNVARVSELLNKGQDPNTSIWKKGTALSLALAGGHEDLVNDLLVAGARPNPTEGSDVSLLEKVASLGEWTGMHLNVEVSVRLAHKLVEHGALLDRQGPRGTPLLLAIREQKIAMVRALLSMGANANLCEKTFKSPLHQRGQPSPPPLGASPLTAAMTQCQHTDMLPFVDALLNAGADPNGMDGGGSLPLYAAVSCSGPVTLVQRLIDAGADPTCPGIKDRNSFEDTIKLYGASEVKALFEGFALRKAMEGMPVAPSRPVRRL